MILPISVIRSIHAICMAAIKLLVRNCNYGKFFIIKVASFAINEGEHKLLHVKNILANNLRHI